MADYSKAVVKLIDLISNILGGFVSPKTKRLNAEADADTIRTISTAIYENPGLPIKYDKDGIVIDATDHNELAARTAARVAIQELKKQQNIESVVGKTAGLLEAEETVSDTPVDKDWAFRFFDSVANISSEEMQTLWAKLLAGEVKQPSSFSFRAMETLRNMTSEEAQLFQKVATYVVDVGDGYLLLSDKSYLSSVGIELLDILRLSESGLINTSSVGYKFSPAIEERTFLKNKKEIIRFKRTVEKKVAFHVGAYLLTGVGKELLQIVDIPEDQAGLLRVLWHLKKLKLSGFEMTLHDIVDDSDKADIKLSKAKAIFNPDK